MKPIVNAHNKKVTSEDILSAATRRCDCARNTTCPMDGNCQKTIRKHSMPGTVTSNLPNYGENKYAGVSALPWKKRFGNNQALFNNRKYEKSSALAKEVWKIKDKYTIDWRDIGLYSLKTFGKILLDIDAVLPLHYPLV